LTQELGAHVVGIAVPLEISFLEARSKISKEILVHSILKK
jgi:hypothetical protein